jgi:hypothetical protein
MVSEGIAILLVKLKGFFDGVRHVNAKFMGPFQVARTAIFLDGSQLSLIPIIKVDYVRSCVKDWVVIYKPDGFAVPISFLRGHVALGWEIRSEFGRIP